MLSPHFSPCVLFASWKTNTACLSVYTCVSALDAAGLPRLRQWGAGAVSPAPDAAGSPRLRQWGAVAVSPFYLTTRTF